MVQLDDATYAELLERAQKASELEAQNLCLKAHKFAPKWDDPEIEILRLQTENQRLREKLGLAVRRLFGPKSERKVCGQEALLFNEVETEAIDAPEPLRQVKAYVRGRRTAQRELNLDGVEIREVECELPAAEQVCPLCSGPVRRMGEQERVKVEVAPIVITITREKQAKYCCCNPDNHPMQTAIVKAPLAPTAFPKSMASASFVAYLMHQKYVMASPLYRQEQEFERLGFPLSRQTMANWVIAGAKWLDLIYLRLQKRLLKEEILHADETVLQVLQEPGSPPTSKSFMWLYRTGRYSPPIVLYDYQPTREREHPERFLKEFTGYLHVDGFPGYEKIANLTLCGCWAHARRKFVEAVEVLPAEKREKGGTTAHQGLTSCDRLFEIERDLKEASPEERQIGRDQRSRVVLEEFKCWLDRMTLDTLPKTAIGVAVRYCIRQWSKLTEFLSDGRLEIDNNRAERSIKPFVTGRKNWLFANTPTGADASATIYSIIETAKENNLDPRTYLQFLFEQLPQKHNERDHQLDKLLPWSELAQAACSKPSNVTIT
jgi:transposase